jgi:hypothetical protein
MGYLHVLNGDATLRLFEETGIPGNKMIWREVLSEGRVPAAIGSEPFWEVRSSFFESFFDVAEEEYHQLTVDEFDKVEAFSEYEEIVLWFEYDLFCQLNMMALLSWFAAQDLNGIQLSLVCVGALPEEDKLVGLGEVSPSIYPSLFKNRRPLSQEDLDFAQQFWATFSSDDPRSLYEIAGQKIDTFPYLPAAVSAHLRRFPSTSNGLNIIEDKMMRIVHSGIRDRRQVVGQVLEEDQEFGFGDWQYFVYLKNLYPLLQEEDGLSVNELGEKVLSGEEDFVKWAQHNYYWGGVHFKSYRWDDEQQKLIRNSDDQTDKQD